VRDIPQAIDCGRKALAIMRVLREPRKDLAHSLYSLGGILISASSASAGLDETLNLAQEALDLTQEARTLWVELGDAEGEALAVAQEATLSVRLWPWKPESGALAEQAIKLASERNPSTAIDIYMQLASAYQWHYMLYHAALCLRSAQQPASQMHIAREDWKEELDEVQAMMSNIKSWGVAGKGRMLKPSEVKNANCPCGSKKKLRDCHARPTPK